ncbi:MULTISPECIES: hypothetical protein [unclassified Streptococcus]|uniref:hypothetical protein n=1 Tax=unclassified Streptococcus TaxID=2608887 RepID=UPI00211AB4B7|nr:MULTISPECIES: hypothetical protein [unclassified Streptococcus]MCQ9211846.1 hypothetical protein [Streptococcus sp. B01]MCQ9212876.1 hypothetical protein [Streptococcus sp. B01]MCQ9212967.1 hypothetical protein [Streptococcus sp. O1]MCQ9214992.1 hypothetical protein [Streptococcus sp. O1]
MENKQKMIAGIIEKHFEELLEDILAHSKTYQEAVSNVCNTHANIKEIGALERIIRENIRKHSLSQTIKPSLKD